MVANILLIFCQLPYQSSSRFFTKREYFVKYIAKIIMCMSLPTKTVKKYMKINNHIKLMMLSSTSMRLVVFNYGDHKDGVVEPLYGPIAKAGVVLEVEEHNTKTVLF